MTRPHPSRFLLSALAVIVAGSSILVGTVRDARAAWPNQPAVNLPVSIGAGNQSRPALVHDGAGGVYIAWDDQTDAFVLRITRSGSVAPGWPAGGISLGSPAGGLFKYIPAIVSDGNGGAIVVWSESTGPNTGVYAQHVTAAGVDPAWPVNGVLLSVMTGDRLVSDVAPDGQGGALVTWRDQGATYDVYAQRVLASGAVPPGWPANGVLLTSAALDQWESAIVSDGAGGAIVAWQDSRSGAGYDIYATRVLATGALDPTWPVGGRAVCTASFDQTVPRIVTDGAGGALIAWEDQRSGVAGGDDFYAQHVQGNGVLDPGWTANGNVVVNAAGLQWSGSAISDGAGGMYMTWADGRVGGYDIYVHHILAGGIDGAWPANGRALCTATGSQGEPALTLDGAGGVIVAWHDNRVGTHFDIYAGHVSAAGVVDTVYPANGRAVCVATNLQLTAVIAGDDNGGAIITWNDQRAGTPDVYAQRLGRHGFLGTPEAEIVSVRDVVLDQGGQVKVSWNASWLDATNDPNLTAYDVYRSVPTALARRRMASGARVASLSSAAGPPVAGQLVTLPGRTDTDYWEFVATTPAVHFPSGYSLLAPTEQDSVAAGNPRTRFIVVARNANYSMSWPSASDSGYSVDNLAPASPSAITGVYEEGVTQIAWNANPEPDVDRYRLYRGSSADFVPGPGNLVAEPTGPSFDDVGPAGAHYKLSAIDIHGNEGPTILLAPSQTVDVPGLALPVRLALLPARPQPARSSVQLEFHLTRETRATLAIHDVAGRRVRTLVDGIQPAGVHRVTWDRINGAGLYFARLEAEGQLRATRVLVVP